MIDPDQTLSKLVSSLHPRVAYRRDLEIYKANLPHSGELFTRIPPRVWLLWEVVTGYEEKIFIALSLPELYDFAETRLDNGAELRATYVSMLRPDDTIDDLIWYDPTSNIAATIGRKSELKTR